VHAGNMDPTQDLNAKDALHSTKAEIVSECTVITRFTHVSSARLLQERQGSLGSGCSFGRM
jgi:hypothetical protein